MRLSRHSSANSDSPLTPWVCSLAGKLQGSLPYIKRTKKPIAAIIDRYRSLLSFPSKILESVVNDTIVRHVYEANNRVTDKQLMGIPCRIFNRTVTNTTYRDMESSCRRRVSGSSCLHRFKKGIWRCVSRHSRIEVGKGLWHIRTPPGLA